MLPLLFTILTRTFAHLIQPGDKLKLIFPFQVLMGKIYKDILPGVPASIVLLIKYKHSR